MNAKELALKFNLDQQVLEDAMTFIIKRFEENNIELTEKNLDKGMEAWFRCTKNFVIDEDEIKSYLNEVK